jgi:hypothetical protein
MLWCNERRYGPVWCTVKAVRYVNLLIGKKKPATASRFRKFKSTIHTFVFLMFRFAKWSKNKTVQRKKKY